MPELGSGVITGRPSTRAVRADVLVFILWFGFGVRYRLTRFFIAPVADRLGRAVVGLRK
jgi:hypothetical protein